MSGQKARRRVARPLTVLGVALVAILASAAPVFGDLPGRLATALDGNSDPMAPIAPDVAAPPLPALSGEQAAQAVTIATQDPRVARLLTAGDQVLGNVVWTTEQSHELLGSLVVLSLNAPRDVDARLPSYWYDESEQRTPPYQAFTRRLRATAVSQLEVLVDLQRQSVV